MTSEILNVSPEEKGQAIVQGLQSAYNDLGGHQLAMYHGFPREWGYKLKDGVVAGVPEDQWFDLCFGIGAYRSGKTYSALLRIVNDATQYPGNEILVVRKRHEQLHNTIVKDLREVFKRVTGDHADWFILDEGAPHPGAYEMVIATPDPKRPSKIIFRIEPDGDEEAVRDSFKGYECGLIIIEEGSQLRAVTLDVLLSRMSKRILIDPLGSKTAPENQWPGFKPYALMLSNPAFEGHWMTTMARTAEQNHARSEFANLVVCRSTMDDNNMLDASYVAKEKARYKDDPIGYQMYILGMDGVKIDGRPVFVGHFDFKQHVQDVKFNPDWPLILGMDFGYQRPRCVFAQLDPEIDGLNVLDELVAKELEAEEFAVQIRNHIKRHFPKVKKMIEWGDPSGFQKTDKGDPTIPRINRLGFQIRPSVNDMDAGHNEIRRLLRENRSKGNYMRPRLVISKACPHLQLAFRQGYTFPVNSKGIVSERPDPRNPFKDIMDAFRYLVMGTFGFAGMTREHASPWNLGRETGDDSADTLPPMERLEIG